MKNTLIIILFLYSLTATSQFNFKPIYQTYSGNTLKQESEMLDRLESNFKKNEARCRYLMKFINENKPTATDQNLIATFNSVYRKLQIMDNEGFYEQDDYRVLINKCENELNLAIEKANIDAKEKPNKLWNEANEARISKQYEKSIEKLDELIKLMPEFEESYYARGYAYNMIGKFDNSIRDFTKYLGFEKKENFENAIYFLAFSYYDTKQYGNAYTKFEQLVNNNKYLETSYMYMGFCQVEQNNSAGAILNFTKAININPKNQDAYFWRARAKSELGDYYGDIVDNTKVIELEPNNSMAYNNRAWAKFNLKKYKEALIDVNTAIRLDDSNYVAFDSKQEILFNMKDFKGCIENCTQAITLNPNLKNSYLFRGRAKYKLGQKVGACEDWSKAGELGEGKAYEFIKNYCK
jgi:Tfp pilus assembly protein PilF